MVAEKNEFYAGDYGKAKVRTDAKHGEEKLSQNVNKLVVVLFRYCYIMRLVKLRGKEGENVAGRNHFPLLYQTVYYYV